MSIHIERAPDAQPNRAHHAPRRSALAAAIAIAVAPALLPQQAVAATDPAVLEQRVAELQRELAQTRAELEAARAEAAAATEQAETAEAELIEAGSPQADKIRIGPLTIGGAMRVNYVLGDYPDRGNGPSRGGNGGNFELDTFRINMDLKYDQLVGKLEYRWYNGYNFLHTGWLGWDFDDGSQVQVGVNRVPFGPGPYGVSQSWFFDQHYYVGLSDDMDLGIKYITSVGDWDLDFAYYARSEWDGRGASRDSARYSYDPVIWDSALAPNGDVVDALPNGYQERNQFNLRAIYNLDAGGVDTDLGASLQYGKLDGRRASNGDHWAVSAHMTNSWNNWLLATQITRYKFDLDGDNLLGTDELLPMGAYDFAWPVAADAWIPAASLSYLYETEQIPWLDSVRPYVEYSNIVKEEGEFNDSELFIVGAAWARNGWYIYSDAAWSNGNFFVGDEGDNFTNIVDGVGDFGVNGNDRWNFRFNINFGYYF